MEKTVQEVRLQFDSFSANEGFARAAVAAFAAQLDPTVAELSELKTAVSEAVTNCVVHAYRDTIGPVTVTVQLLDDRRVVVKVRDKGCGIENVSRAMEPLFTTAPGEDRAGLGFAVMQSFSDLVKVRSSPGRGTVVTLQKTFSPRRRDV